MFETFRSKANASSGGALRFLVCEDEPLIGMVVKDALERAGHHVVWVHTGGGAYAALRGWEPRFDILILDIDLGIGTTGFDIARTARTLDPDVGVIFSSGNPTDWVETFGVANAGYISKPFSETTLLAAVERLTAGGGYRHAERTTSSSQTSA